MKNDLEPAGLYNLTDDVGEAKNLAAERPERVRGLRAAWEQWNAELKDPLPEFSR